MSEPTTNYFCSQGCGAVLTTRTAAAHACGAGTSGSAVLDPNRPQQAATGQESALLSTAEIAAIEARAARWLLSSFDTAAMRQGAFALIGQSLPALLASHAALTARLAAVVGERALLITVAEWASTLRRRAQSHEDERLYDQAVARLDGALYALMRYRQARRLEPPDGR